MTDIIPATDLVPTTHETRALGGLPYLSDYMRLADAICRTQMVPDALRGKADAVLAVVLAGNELGIGPMQALQGIDLIQGRPSISPELMRALVLDAGHTLILDATDTEATLRCHRKDWPIDEWATFRWDMADATRAGLAGKENWTKYPRAMLCARVTSEACRQTFPDVIAGLSYTPDEVADMPAWSSAPAPEPEVDWVHRETIVAIREAIKALPAHVREASVKWPFVCGVDVLHEDKTAAIDEADGQRLLAQLLTMVEAAEPDPVEDAEVVLPCDADQAELPTAAQIVDAIGDLSDYSDEIF